MNTKKVLIIILLAASLLRLYGLARGDTVNDEVFYAFRGLGMLDFDEAHYQTTPLEWFDSQIPWWTHLSFHDHPPLVFLIEHYSIKIFGENNIAIRLPSAILGIVSIYLLYLIALRLFSPGAALLSALFMAVTVNHVYISRLGLQESYVIFFVLLAIYFFLKALQKDKYFVWTGLALGLGFLTKYNVFILVPIFLTYLVFFRRSVFANKNFWLGAVLSVALFSPVIVYNLEMYRSVGHFDFQLSYILHQPHPEWTVEPGKDIGSLGDRFRNFIPRLINSNSWLFLSLTVLSLLAFLGALLKKPKVVVKNYGFLIITLLYLFLMIMLVGPAYRFLTIITPFLALVVAVLLTAVYQKYFKSIPKTAYFLLGIIILFEIFYSINNEIIYYPRGPTPWFSSKIRYENYNWGYNELDDYLNKEFAGKMPALTFDLQYQFLEKLREAALADGLQAGLAHTPFLIVYGGNFDDGPKLWVMERRITYHAWPVLRLEDYLKYLHEQGSDYFERAGFKDQYFIMQTNMVPPEEFSVRVKNIAPLIIKNQRGDEVFKVYKIYLKGK